MTPAGFGCAVRGLFFVHAAGAVPVFRGQRAAEGVLSLRTGAGVTERGNVRFGHGCGEFARRVCFGNVFGVFGCRKIEDDEQCRYKADGCRRKSYDSLDHTKSMCAVCIFIRA